MAFFGLKKTIALRVLDMGVVKMNKIPEEKLKEWREECVEVLLKLGYSPAFTACRSHKEYAIYLAACKKRQEEVDRLRAENENLRSIKSHQSDIIDMKSKEIHRLKDLVKRAKEHIEKGYFEDHNDWYRWIKEYSEVIGE